MALFGYQTPTPTPTPMGPYDVSAPNATGRVAFTRSLEPNGPPTFQSQNLSHRSCSFSLSSFSFQIFDVRSFSGQWQTISCGEIPLNTAEEGPRRSPGTPNTGPLSDEPHHMSGSSVPWKERGRDRSLHQCTCTCGGSGAWHWMWSSGFSQKIAVSAHAFNSTFFTCHCSSDGGSEWEWF